MSMKFYSRFISYLVTAGMVVLLVACGGGDGDGASTGTASLSLTDAPVDEAKEVVVRFDGAEFKAPDGDRIMFYLSDTTGTGTCEVVDVHDPDNPCAINLMDYQNGETVTLLDNVTLPAGKHNWVRLILNDAPGLGPGYITLLDDRLFDLRVPSGAQTGLKLHSGFIVAADNHTNYTIDFDLRKSVHDPVGSSDYILRPSLRITDNSEVGTLSGTVHSSFFGGGSCTGAVYVFPDGTSDAPDDEDGDGYGPDPITTVLVPDDGTHGYEVGFLTEGDYLIAFTCDALADNPDVNDDGTVGFLSEASVHITAGEIEFYDFPAAP
jgi:hypothetical protein